MQRSWKFNVMILYLFSLNNNKTVTIISQHFSLKDFHHSDKFIWIKIPLKNVVISSRIKFLLIHPGILRNYRHFSF